MGRIQEMEEMLFQRYKWGASKYYDYPDGEDLLGKLSYTSKMAFFGGLFHGLLYAYATRPLAVSKKERLIRIASRTLPYVGMACAFTITTFYATRLRKKDDEINHALGGLAAAAVLGACTDPITGIMGAIFFSGLGAAQKCAKLNNSTLFPETKPMYQSSYSMRTFDFSLVPDVKGNWTKEPEQK